MRKRGAQQGLAQNPVGLSVSSVNSSTEGIPVAIAVAMIGRGEGGSSKKSWAWTSEGLR